MPTHRPVQNSTPLTENNQSDLSNGDAALSEVDILDMVVEKSPIRLQILRAALNDAHNLRLTIPLDLPVMRGMQPTPVSSISRHDVPLHTLNNHRDVPDSHDKHSFSPWGESSPSTTIKQVSTSLTKHIEQEAVPKVEAKEATVSPTSSDSSRISNNDKTPTENPEKNTIQSSNDHIDPTHPEKTSQVNQSLALNELEQKDNVRLEVRHNQIQPTPTIVENIPTSLQPLSSELKISTSSGDSTSIQHLTGSTSSNRAPLSAQLHDTGWLASQANDDKNQQSQEHITQRSEHVRLLQQIHGSLSNEETPHSNTHPSNDSTTYGSIVSPQHTKLHRSAQALETTRASIFNSLSTLENKLADVSPVVSVQASDPLVTIPQNIQGRQHFSTSNPSPQVQYDPMRIQRSDRNTPDRVEPAMQTSTLGSAYAAPLGTIHSTPVQIEPHKVSSILSTSIPSLLAQLREFTRNSKNLSLLQSFDSPLENACLTIATGIAVGLVGPTLALRTTYRLTQRLRTALTEENAAGKESDTLRDPSEFEKEQSLLKQFDGALAIFSPLLSAQGISNASVVADVAGIVFYADSMIPTSFAKITSAELGTCITTEDGIFIFSNIPIGTSYTLSIEDPRNTAHLHTVEGTCSEVTYVRIGLS